jgi:hypothetical protein
MGEYNMILKVEVKEFCVGCDGLEIYVGDTLRARCAYGYYDVDGNHHDECPEDKE